MPSACWAEEVRYCSPLTRRPLPNGFGLSVERRLNQPIPTPNEPKTPPYPQTRRGPPLSAVSCGAFADRSRLQHRIGPATCKFSVAKLRAGGQLTHASRHDRFERDAHGKGDRSYSRLGDLDFSP